MSQADKDETGMVTLTSLCMPGCPGTQLSCIPTWPSSPGSIPASASPVPGWGGRGIQEGFSKIGGKARLGTVVDLGLTSSLVEIAENKISVSITRY